jgi:MFS family permease
MTDVENSEKERKPSDDGGMKKFMFVWSGQFISILGSSMTGFALAIWAWMLTGQATALALVGFFSFAPAILLSPVAGALVDRWDRKRTMILSDLAAGMETVIVLILILTGGLEIWHLCVLGAISGAFGAFQFPAFSAAITMMVDKRHYGRTSSLMSIAGSASAIIAPVTAVALLGTVGIVGILVFDIITFVYAISTVLLINIPNPPPSEVGKQSKGSLWKESVFGFKYIRERRGLLGLMVFFLSFNLVATLGNTVLAPMILARSGNSSFALGTVQSMFGIGGVIGGVAIAVWGGPKYKVGGIILGALGGSLLGVAVMGIGQSLAFWALGAFMMALLFPLIGASSQAIWQAKVAPDVQGRVFATRRMLAQACVPIAMLLAGPLADHVFEPAMMPGGNLSNTFGWLVGTGPGAGMGLMLVISGILTAAVCVFALASPTIRNVESDMPDYDALPGKSSNPAATPS